LQDIGVVHLCQPAPEPPMAALRPSARWSRHVARVERALGEAEEAMARLEPAASASPECPELRTDGVVSEVRFVRRAHRAAVALTGEQKAIEGEREQTVHLVRVLDAFAGMDLAVAREFTRTFFLVLSQGGSEGSARLQRAIAEAIGDAFAFYERPIAGGELALALVVPEAKAATIEALLPEAGVRELDLPEECELSGPAAAAEAMRRRLPELDDELAGLAARHKRLADWLWPGLVGARAALHEWLITSEALATAAVTEHLFVIEGWLPASERDALGRTLAEREGECIIAVDVAQESWSAHDVPVAIQNPRIFRPFEIITRWLPMPRYGTVDPTPFVAAFFPMFFGLMLGDVGYGAMLGGLALLGWKRSREGSVFRSISQIAGVCAVFSILFGLFFGELFGNLGHRLLGMRPVAFSRGEAFVPFLVLAVSIGFVHVVLGLVLSALSSIRSDPRQSLGRGLSAVMLVLTAAVLLAAVNILPQAFFTPAAVALLLSFFVLIALEGLIGPVELLSRLSNIFSYARIMALGTASVMLATVANDMVGAFGGAAVGVIFATLFHLVNFGLGVFSPTIHALRLHFVEFFGTFYSPGGLVYRPLRHWRPPSGQTPQSAES
jgi:V/A-type H+-transporting ATPase subunit I